MPRTLLLIFLLGVLVVLIVIFVMCMLYLISLGAGNRKHPPFIRTNKAVLDEIVKAFGPIGNHAHVYELGAGDGRVLMYLASKNQNAGARFIGIEKHIWPWLLSIWHSYRMPCVTFKRANMFKEDVSDATHMFLYLMPEAVDALLPKLMRELHTGTVLVSLDYAFTGKAPEHTISLEHLNLKLGKRLFVYKF